MPQTWVFVMMGVVTMVANGCINTDKDDTDTVEPDDLDGDGFSAADDCDDSDAAVNTDAEEICDGIDNNCDGTVDEDDATDAVTWFEDSDGDGYGNDEESVIACEAPAGHVVNNTDCDDSNGNINPDAVEVCDGIDEDCDGMTEDCLSGTVSIADAWSAGRILLIEGGTTGDLFGTAPIAVDVDGDGLTNDLLVGAPYAALGGYLTGAVYLFYDVDVIASANDTAYVGVHNSATFEGSQTTERIYSSNAGDFSNDNIPDILINSYGGSRDSEGNVDGALYVFHGAASAARPFTSSYAVSTAQSYIKGAEAEEFAGGSFLVAELDGLLKPALIASARHRLVDSYYHGGRAYIFNTISVDRSLDSERAAKAIIEGSNAGVGFGDKLGALDIGDLGGSGSKDDDLLLGAPEYNSGTGRVYLFEDVGTLNGTYNAESDADIILSWPNTGEKFGNNGFILDGGDTIAVSAHASEYHGNAEAGSLMFYEVATIAINPFPTDTIFNTNAGERLGLRAASAGDFNNDGNDDVIIGISGRGASGSVWIVFGPTTAINTTDIDTLTANNQAVQIEGVSGYNIGNTVAGLGDVDGDGYDDVFIGANTSDNDLAYAGAGYLIFGR